MTLLELLMVALPALAPWVREHPRMVDRIALAAMVHGVPQPVLAAVCVVESGLGSARVPHRVCGVMNADNEHQPEAAAHALARWHRVCGTWRGAMALFHHGRGCQPGPDGYSIRAARLAARIGGER